MKTWFLSFMEAYRDQIADEWVQQVNENYPNQFDLEKLRETGCCYLSIVKQLHIPVKEHPYLEHLPKRAWRSIESGIPITHIFHICQLFRRIFFSTFNSNSQNYCSSSNEITLMLNTLAERIDYIQKAICDVYSEHSQSIIKNQEQLIQELHKDRLSLLGQMASSMAHEIKNPLFAIEGFLKLIRSEAQGSSKIERYVDIMDQEIQHLFQHIQVFLSFSRNQVDEEAIVDLSTKCMVDSIHKLMTPRLTSEGIDLAIEIEESVVRVQRGGIQQVLVNLVSNSVDALNGMTVKKIRIEGKRLEDTFHLSIIDNGPGIPIELKQKLFVPFITGKVNGSGLGLAICKQIIEKNKGSIQYSSEEGRTVFTVQLPIRINGVKTGGE